jgi:hypothetical protein
VAVNRNIYRDGKLGESTEHRQRQLLSAKAEMSGVAGAAGPFERVLELRIGDKKSWFRIAVGVKPKGASREGGPPFCEFKF